MSYRIPGLPGTPHLLLYCIPDIADMEKRHVRESTDGGDKGMLHFVIIRIELHLFQIILEFRFITQVQARVICRPIVQPRLASSNLSHWRDWDLSCVMKGVAYSGCKERK